MKEKDKIDRLLNETLLGLRGFRNSQRDKSTINFLTNMMLNISGSLSIFKQVFQDVQDLKQRNKQLVEENQKLRSGELKEELQKGYDKIFERIEDAWRELREEFK